MIIQRIELHNFGSYRHCEVDLSSIKAATVCGPNGAGKSTLFFDAVTYALFGKARASADELMKLGSSDMTVLVDFIHEGKRYQVVRTRSLATKVGKTSLSFAVYDESIGDWTPIGGSSIADTQAKIEAVLHADYNLLLHTSFFMQGQADRLTVASPSERMRVLSSVLDLEHYETLRQLAVRKRNRAEGTADALMVSSVVHDELTKELEDDEKEIERLRNHLQETRDTIASLEAQLKEAKAQQAQYERSNALTNEHKKALARIEDDIQRYTQECNAAESQIAKLHKDLERKRAQWESAQREIKDIQAQHQKVVQGYTRSEQHLNELHSELERIRAQREQALRAATLVQECARKIDAIKSESAKKTSELRQKIAQCQSDLQLLDRIPYAENCDRCQFTVRAREAKQRIPGLEAALRKAESIDVSELETELAKHKEHASALERLNNEFKELQSSYERRQGIFRVLDREQRQLSERLESIKAALQSRADIESTLIHSIQRADEQRAYCLEHLRRLERERGDAKKQIEQLESAAQELRNINNRIISLEQEHSAAKDREQSCQVRITEINVHIQNLNKEIDRIRESEKELERLRIYIRMCDILAEAYQIIPRMIVESALPFIEHHANAILSRIGTPGMRVEFRTQKALKSRDAIAETLDIVVRDAYGERKLEVFSGGERARLDLAIRIALSKLLAQRAGAHVETLIIDEAFSSIDGSSIELIAESLALVTSEFPLTLVVTHDERLQHAFPTRIEVSKTQDGSSVAIV